MLLLIWVVAIVIVIYLFFKQKYSYFRTHGINSISPWPIFGNLGRSILRLEHITEHLCKQYQSFPEDRFVGHYEFMNPVIVIRDLDLIKQICVKDYESFLDHRVKIDEEVDPLFGRNLLSLKGQKWRDMRATLSPAFTGSKMRHMLPFMLECCKEMTESLKEEMLQKGVDTLELETKDLCTRFTNDVVATCAFGLKVNSHKEKENYFYQKGKVAANFTFKQLLLFLGCTSFPRVMNKLNLSLFDIETTSFFRNIIGHTMKDREERNIIRPDMIHLLMEAKKGNLSHDDKPDDNTGFATVEESAVGKTVARRVWTDDDLVAQAVLFFIAGFDTVATLMAFLLYELAVNPDVQEKLFKEIKKTNDKTQGKADFNSIQEMQYLDMVVSECLRKWPPALSADRLCTKPHNIGKPSFKATKDYIVKKGDGVWIPIWALHRSPEYYPNPEKFDPERFSEENKHTIDPRAYLPFGAGPRNCIGSRFALMETKVLIHHLLKNFSLEPSAKTSIPIRLARNSCTLKIEGGNWLKLAVRT